MLVALYHSKFSVPGQNHYRYELLVRSRRADEGESILSLSVLSSSGETPVSGRSACLDLVKLAPLMERTTGRPEISIGLIDGPIEITHPDLAADNIRDLFGKRVAVCAEANSAICIHGTFVAGVLLARRGSAAPAICPSCTLLVRPIFAEVASDAEQMPSATPWELAQAITQVIDAGVRILNLSAALVEPSFKRERELDQALDYAARRGVVVVAAAGNQGALGSSAITRHRWVIPVVAYDLQGRPMALSNLGSSIGRRGLGAPGDGITSLGAAGAPLVMAGTSVAAPFVTGAVALMWSEFPAATAAEVKSAITQSNTLRRTTIIPPLLNAWESYRMMAKDRI
jgi:subtilisin family serine protease